MKQQRRRYTYRANHIGRLRIEAAEILTKGFGFRVDPDDIKPATGAYRTDWRQDVYRWEVFSCKGGMPIVCGCWLTLTEFVRQAKKAGFHVNKDSEIYPNEESQPCPPNSPNSD